jgi:tight adherence protein B
MDGVVLYGLIGLLTALAIGGVGFAFVGGAGNASKKRMASVARPQATGRGAKGAGDNNQQRRKNVQALLKELEQKANEQKKSPTIRRRIEMAGLNISTRTFWIASAIAGVMTGVGVFLSGQHFVFALLGIVAGGLGLPRWVLGFLKNRREKKFTKEFAPAIDVIVRSVKSGLPVGEALKVVANEIADPVGSEFRTLNENMRVGLTMEQALKRMFERMPTAEVNFFAIVMTIQQKSGGNLSEALSNLAGVLRDRKRMQGKIRAMSSEAKASAAIIGSLPPGVTTLIYITTPDYIGLLFTTEIGNLLLVGCGIWMGLGILVMKKMVAFKF